ncbi:MAG TPA: PA14 domain-containing protein [Sedimentisphaerales bacterium]|jgi:hypothetical protein|nr:PA14 domain-containing protein [Sedimentisphaerales bacterium]HNU29358.1 PA14 domain-containing protein [Sedimentisphaerales bacterium]
MSTKSRFLFITALLLASCTVVCGQGLKGEYFSNMTLSGSPVLTRTENVDFNWGGNSPGDPLGTDLFSVRWTGSLMPPETGEYTFATRSDDGVRLWVAGDSVIYNWGDHSATLNTSRPVHLDAGEAVSIQLEFYENGGDAVCQFYWAGPGFEQEIVPAIVLSPTTVQNLRARKPIPADGTLDFNPEVPLIQWTAGDTAMFHNVYFGTTPDLTEADRVSTLQKLAITMYYHPFGITPGTRYYWRVDEVEKDRVTTHVGKVWTFLVQAPTAYYPTPADGAVDASINADLTWLPGTGALQHQVYFSEDLDAVTQGTAAADKGIRALADANFAPEGLEVVTTYYWRVDEILTGGAVRTGDVWSFTTCLPIDDFESYTDNQDAGEAVFNTWIDGWTNGTGSLVGYENANGGTFCEIAIVHGGWQSMPFDFNNVDSPYYSEIEREYTSPQDWTASGVNTLVLFIRGKVTNPITPLYVTLRDSSSHVATIQHSNPAIAQTLLWNAWRIPLTEFATVNPAKIKKISLTLGDKTNPTARGAGMIFIDDICLTKGM